MDPTTQLSSDLDRKAAVARAEVNPRSHPPTGRMPRAISEGDFTRSIRSSSWAKAEVSGPAWSSQAGGDRKPLSAPRGLVRAAQRRRPPHPCQHGRMAVDARRHRRPLRLEQHPGIHSARRQERRHHPRRAHRGRSRQQADARFSRDRCARSCSGRNGACRNRSWCVELWPSMLKGGAACISSAAARDQGRPAARLAQEDWAKEDIRNYNVILAAGPQERARRRQVPVPQPAHGLHARHAGENLFVGEASADIQPRLHARAQSGRLAELLLAEDKGWDAATIDELLTSGPRHNDDCRSTTRSPCTSPISPRASRATAPCRPSATCTAMKRNHPGAPRQVEPDRGWPQPSRSRRSKLGRAHECPRCRRQGGGEGQAVWQRQQRPFQRDFRWRIVGPSNKARWPIALAGPSHLQTAIAYRSKRSVIAISL